MSPVERSFSVSAFDVASFQNSGLIAPVTRLDSLGFESDIGQVFRWHGIIWCAFPQLFPPETERFRNVWPQPQSSEQTDHLDHDVNLHDVGQASLLHVLVVVRV
jgi:hypothetical protein